MMKKLFLLVFVTCLSIAAANAQKHWTVGVSGGIPVGDVSDTHSFHLSGDVAYRANIINLLDIGGLVGYSHYFGDSVEGSFGNIDFEDFQFLPLAASGRLRILAILFVGTDLGYAVSLTDGLDGGFYFRPNLGLNLGIANIVVSYSNISVDGGSIAAVNGGIEIKL